jgi:hypothetical protein
MLLEEASAGNNSLAFPDIVETICGQIGEGFDFSGRPENLEFIHLFVVAKPEVDSEIVLRKIASTAEDLSFLDEVA